MKAVAISIVDGFHYRYLVQSGIVSELIKDEKIELVIFAQKQLVNLIESDFESSKAIKSVHRLPNVKLSKLGQLFLSLKKAKSNRLSETSNIKNESKSFFMQKVFKICSSLIPGKLVGTLGRVAFQCSEYADYLAHHDVDVVIASTPAQKLPDVSLIMEAKKQGILTLSPVYSWDNLTAKGPFAFNVDHLLVWNDVLANEAKYYHGYDSDSVHVTGVPIYDDFQTLDFGTKEAFCKYVGIKEGVPLLTVTTIPRVYYGDGHKRLVELLVKNIKDKSIEPCNILIRPHPMDDTDYSDLEISGMVVVDNYGSKPDSSLKNWKPSKDNITHLGKTMKHSDIVINLASTITIDAAWFDTPVINVAIDFESADYEGSVKRFYQYTHYKEVVECEASVVTNSIPEFIEAVNFAIDNPMHKALQRKILTDKMVLGREFPAVRKTIETIKKLIKNES
jgi:hypothetical protein